MESGEEEKVPGAAFGNYQLALSMAWWQRESAGADNISSTVGLIQGVNSAVSLAL